MFKTVMMAAMLMSGAASADEMALTTKNLHRYVANHVAWNTNSYWIEGKDGIALIDAQLLISDAKALAVQIKATGKPLLGVIITHPHLDHYGGLPTLRDMLGDFPVYAAKGTADNMAKVHKEMMGFYPMPNMWGEAFDERLVAATNIVEDGATVSIAGIDFQIKDLGAGEAPDNIVAYQPDLKVVFAGDTFYPHAHYYVGEGHLQGALDHLGYLKASYAADQVVLPGHNDMNRIASADAQIAYITAIRDAVTKAMETPANIGEGGFLTREARRAVVGDLVARFAGYDDYGFAPRQIMTGNVYGAEQEILRGKAGK